jgi:hypothetical protein
MRNYKCVKVIDNSNSGSKHHYFLRLEKLRFLNFWILFYTKFVYNFKFERTNKLSLGTLEKKILFFKWLKGRLFVEIFFVFSFCFVLGNKKICQTVQVLHKVNTEHLLL